MKPQRDVVAYHEAGHAIAHCRFLSGIRDAHICPNGVYANPDGTSVACEGVVVGLDEFTVPDVPFTTYPEDERPQILERSFRRMIVYLAGPSAEVQYSRNKLLFSLVGNGRNDWENAGVIADWLTDGDDDKVAILLARAELLAVGFVRDFRGSSVMAKNAKGLLVSGVRLP
jgi:hypothetical protein